MPPTAIGRFFVCAILCASSWTTRSEGQRHGGYPTPPSPAVREDQTTSPQKKRLHLDIVTMEREAKEIAALASTIPSDIEQLKKGLLPSDAVDKLKRIEKLSKQLRGQIRP
jgi:hypothetical protein